LQRQHGNSAKCKPKPIISLDRSYAPCNTAIAALGTINNSSDRGRARNISRDRSTALIRQLVLVSGSPVRFRRISPMASKLRAVPQRPAIKRGIGDDSGLSKLQGINGAKAQCHHWQGLRLPAPRHRQGRARADELASTIAYLNRVMLEPRLALC
jgi:hypothetical protein